ncbi:hypothetical protein K440DRAFT_637799 [Wilcoxina mikolae CBS 423.85]|nr:hypothetical protein K440DRAFT_637799 [Wilcoxina mikolae CBS 423.85]
MSRPRPKSAFFQSAEGSMQRITNFFNSSDTKLHLQRNAPPTPPLAPDVGYPSLSGRLRVAVPQSDPRDGVPPPDGAYGDFLALTPKSSNTPYLQPLPPSPVIAPFSIPGTSSGISSTSASGLTPLELPRLRKKQSGRFGKKDSETSQIAWLLEAGCATNPEPYDINPLAKGEPAKDLWYSDGDTLVYLTSPDSTNSKYKDPVFRIHSCSLMFSALRPYIVDATPSLDQPERQQPQSQFAPTDLFLDVPVLNESRESHVLESDDNDQGPTINVPGHEDPVRDNYTSAISQVVDFKMANATEGLRQPQQAEIVNEDQDEQRIMYKIYYPIIEDDLASRPVTPSKKLKKQPKTSVADAGDRLQRLIEARNLFAFLSRAPLVASQKKALPFDIFSKIFVQLNFQEDMTARKIQLAEGHLQTYIDELKLDDIRNDDDAIVEALVMGEMWHSVRLYHEGFIHASGRWADIDNHPGLQMVSATTISRLDRAHIDLHQIRLVNIKNRIPNFEFPSVWVGEGRYPEYKSWRNGYDRMRSLIMHHMKYVFGSWPPKAGKHGKGGGSTETGGLNRIVLKRLYDDVCCVYDLTVDREWLHGERIHFEGTQGSSDGEESGDGKDRNERHRKTMRTIMGEFDKSSVPVQPEIPFDLPRLPYRLSSTTRKKKVGLFARFSKKFKSEEISEVLQNSYNPDAVQQYSDSHLVKSFMEMEREFGLNKTIEDLINARRGAWIFIYCLLQSLVLVVVDGQGLRYGEGVEYFLCENVKGISPWEKGSNRRQTRMSGLWVNGPGGILLNSSGMSSAINLGINPDDEIEMTYRRSHCWEAAEDWRLVRADSSDEGFENEELYGYLEGYLENNHERRSSSAGYSGEYTSGQQVPQSPLLEAHQGEFAAYNDQLSPVVEEMQRLEIDGQGVIYQNGYPQQYPPEPRQSPSPTSHPVYQHPQYHNDSGYQLPQQYDGRATPPKIPAPLTPVKNPQPTLSPLNMQPFDFDITPLGAGSRKTSPVQSRSTSPTTQSRSASPAGRVPVPQARTWSPVAQSPSLGPIRKSSAPVSGSSSPGAQSPILGPLRKSSAPVSGTSSPLRYSPVMKPEGRASPYSAYSSPRGSPVLGPQARSNTLPRRL